MPNLVTYNMHRLPTKRWGLSNEFSIYPEFDDNADWTDLCNLCQPSGTAFSAANQMELQKYVEPWMRSIVEIGVSRDGWEYSSTKILLDNKHLDCCYLGIDLGDRNFILDKSTNVRFKQHSSWDVQSNLATIFENGYPWIDLLLIDGDHSVNSVLREWEYAKFIRPNGGIVVLHDTNFHPGPWCLVESVDPEIFTVIKLCESHNDFGMTVLRRK